MARGCWCFKFMSCLPFSRIRVHCVKVVSVSIFPQQHDKHSSHLALQNDADLPRHIDAFRAIKKRVSV